MDLTRALADFRNNPTYNWGQNILKCNECGKELNKDELTEVFIENLPLAVCEDCLERLIELDKD